MVTCGVDGRVQSVALMRKYFWTLDENIEIDNHNWAVTFVSARNGFASSGRTIQTGHAMIACEGVNDNSLFLKYIHLTTLRGEGDQERRTNQARVELLLRASPMTNMLNGPTWVRHRTSVERLVESAEQASTERRYVCK